MQTMAAVVADNEKAMSNLRLDAELDVPEFRHRAESILDKVLRTAREGKNLHPALSLRTHLGESVRTAFDTLIEDAARRHRLRVYTARDVTEYDETNKLIYLPEVADNVDELFVDERGECNMAEAIASGDSFPNATQFRAYMNSEGVSENAQASLTRAIRRAQIVTFFRIVEHLINETIPLPDQNSALAELDRLTFCEDKYNLVTFAAKAINLQRRAYGEKLALEEDNQAAVIRTIEILQRRVPDMDSLDSGGEHAVSVIDAPNILTLRRLLDRLRYHTERRANKRSRDEQSLERASMHLGESLTSQQSKIFLQNVNAHGYDKALRRLSTHLRTPRKAQRVERGGKERGRHFEVQAIHVKKFLPYREDAALEALGIPPAIYIRARNQESQQRSQAKEGLRNGQRLPVLSDAELQKRFCRGKYGPGKEATSSIPTMEEKAGLFPVTLACAETEEAFMSVFANMALGETRQTYLKLPPATQFKAAPRQPRPYVHLGFGGKTEKCLVDTGCSLPAAISRQKINEIYERVPYLVGHFQKFPADKRYPLIGVNGEGAARVVGIVELSHTVKVMKDGDVPYTRKYAVIADCARELPLIWGLPTIVEERLMFSEVDGAYRVASMPAPADGKQAADPVSEISQKSVKALGQLTLQTPGSDEVEAGEPRAPAPGLEE